MEDINRMLGGSQMLTNILLHQKTPLFKLGLGGYNHDDEFNKSLNFIKASISLGEDCTKDTNASKDPNKERSSCLLKWRKWLQSKRSPLKILGKVKWCNKSQGKWRSKDMPPRMRTSHIYMQLSPKFYVLVIIVTKSGTFNKDVGGGLLSKRGN